MTLLTMYERLLVELEYSYDDPEVREHAYFILKHLTKQDFGYDAKAWRKWLLANNASFGSGSNIKRLSLNALP